MPKLVLQQNAKIDGRRDLKLTRKILRHLNDDSRFFVEEATTVRRLDAFEGEDEGRVFMHYANLIDAKFVQGFYDPQRWRIVAQFLTWEGHDLLDRLEKELG